MHTVIILNKHSSDLLKDFKFLFKPFVDEEIISFCDWNESGTDIKTSVPDLYKQIKGKQEWRAIVIGTDSMYEHSQNPIADAKNPFDFPGEVSEDGIPKESNVPLIRLSHMLCGFPVLPVKDFEKGFEYFDDEKGKLVRVREAELSEEDIYLLVEKYGEGLKSIYLEEKGYEEAKEAQKKIAERYSFTDVRPREMIFISTRKHCETEDHIYASWKTQLEMESSNFCSRNNYPSSCRFLCYSITNSENSRYMKELVEFWLSVLTVSINKIPASTLQAYKLYRLGMDMSDEELGSLLNKHLNRMEAAYGFVQERLRMRPEYSFEPDEEMVKLQNVPVIFEGSTSRDLFIKTNQIGLSRDCPEDELMFWNEEIREKQVNMEKYLKAPRRAIDKSSQHLKNKAESFFGDEFELDKFQVEDLEEEIQQLELEVLTCDTHNIIDECKIKKEMQKIDKQVRKDISVRMRKSLVIGSGAAALLIYMVGYFPYLVNALMLGKKEFFASLGLTVAAVAFTAVGGLISLLILRKQIIQSMERFNTLMKELMGSVNASAKRFEKYFSMVCTYMKAQSVYAGIRLKSDSLSSVQFALKAHKQALRVSIARDEEIAAAYGIKRIADFEKNITTFFNESKLPRDNALYYYETKKEEVEVPLNDTGDMVKAPYKFIAKLKIEREDIYDDTKGDN